MCPYRDCQILTMMLRKFNFPTISLHSMMKQVRSLASSRYKTLTSPYLAESRLSFYSV